MHNNDLNHVAIFLTFSMIPILFLHFRNFWISLLLNSETFQDRLISSLISTMVKKQTKQNEAKSDEKLP